MLNAHNRHRHPWSIALLALFLIAALDAQSRNAAQPKVTSPKEQFGNNLGDDYFLTTYTQLVEYWAKLDKESDRMIVQEIGKTAEGRPHLMAILTAPENFKKLDRYKEIARRLAHAEGLTDEQARALATEGRAVVWIDGGLHATEVLGAQQLMETVYQLASRTDPETMRFLNDVIVLATHANPDGQELVSNWYMREKDPARRSTGGIPRLYQKYIGHDNNRDFYMSTQPETININRILYHEWFPQIVYNHHQTGPAGTVLFAPPFRDPFNFNYDPLVPLGIDLVGAAMHGRFAAEGKPGATMRKGASYSTWWNGGLRTTVYFHNMIGLLTETIGNPTPIEIPFLVQRQLPSADLPYPIAPQKWHFRQSIEYSMTANRAVLDVASRYRETFLFNIYRMGKNSIERGSTDSWTVQPRKIAAVQAVMQRDNPGGGRGRGGATADAPGGDAAPGGRGGRGGRGGGGGSAASAKYYSMLREPATRDARGYILAADQADFLTATKFVNALIKVGITVHRATAPFQAGGKTYPAGSYVVKSAQAFRPHVLDMFEPQDHPDDIPYPGGAPTPPYDSAGWTLAFQMGVQFDRILDGFDGAFEKVSGLQKPPAGKVAEAAGVVGYLLSHQVNDAVIATNRLLKNGEDVYWVRDAFTAAGKSYAPGTIFIPSKASTGAQVQKLAADLGLEFQATAARPGGAAYQLKPVRIGLWDRYGGSMPSGWTRWIFEQYEFPFEVVYPQTLDAGNLNAKFDVLVFVDGGIPERDGDSAGGGGGGGGGGATDSIPAEFRGWLGTVTVSKTVPQLKKFVEDGGTILAIGGSTSLAGHFELPITDALVERTTDGTVRGLPREKFYVPGSVLQVAVDNTHPLAYGMGTKVDVFFDNSPTFSLLPAASLRGVRPVAWFDTDKPLRSGWAWGQHYLEGGVAVAEATVGKGKLFVFGPEIAFRAQPHGTFKFLFNGIYYGPARATTVGGGTATQ